METIINTQIPEFNVQAYHKGEFKTVTNAGKHMKLEMRIAAAV